MKQILRVIAVLAITAGLFPSSLYADSASKTFRVSVTIPERIQMHVPTSLRVQAVQPEKLMMRTEAFGIGPETNVGKNLDTCVVFREIAGRPFRVFTMTVL